jgi:hypothetical protein
MRRELRPFERLFWILGAETAYQSLASLGGDGPSCNREVTILMTEALHIYGLAAG